MPILRYILSLIITAFLIYCATKGMPQGGPRDTTAPEIVKTFPKSDSTNIKYLEEIIIHFSEPIEAGSAMNAVFSSPPLNFELEWDDEEILKIILNDSLQDNRTYVFTFGTNIVDYRKNKLKASYQLAFSTGDSIDQGKIEGFVFDKPRDASVSILAYDINDSLDLTKKPTYFAQTDQQGNYSINYMKESAYRLIALNDINNNLIIDSDREQIGITQEDIFLTNSNLFAKSINFRLTTIDTTSPGLLSARSINSFLQEVRFSEEIFFSGKNIFSIRDSLSGRAIEILAISQNIESDNILNFYTEQLDSGKVYLFSAKTFRDSSDNRALFDSTLSFKVNKKSLPDSFFMKTLEPQDSTRNFAANPVIYLEFSNPVDSINWENNFFLTDFNADTLKSIYRRPSPFEVEMLPVNILTYDSAYTIHLNLGNVKDIWGTSAKDSLIKSVFFVTDGSNFGEIAGRVNFPDQNVPLFVGVKKFGRKDLLKTTQTDSSGRFYFERIADGFYQLNAYADLDTNNVYSFGHLYPFSFSEPYVIYPDTVKVRRRWETNGIIIDLK